MMYDFESLGNRENTGNMKQSMISAEFMRDDRIVFAGAEMDFPTAPVIIDALKTFAAKGMFGYTLPDNAYLQAVCWWLRNARNTIVSPQEIIPTLGTIFSVGTAMRAFTQPGDGVILIHPVYYRYDARVRENGRRIVSIPLMEINGVYSLDEQALEAQMAQPANKLLILCNPHNPLGKVFSPDELDVIAGLAKKHDVLVFSDEIFAEVTFNGYSVKSFVDIAPEHAITCTSLGKVFNLTGVNHANVIIRSDKLRAAFVKQRNIDHFGSIDPFFYTAVLAGYSPEGFRWMEAMKAHVWDVYTEMRAFLADKLPGIRMSPLEGGFVVWIDFRSLRMDEDELTLFLEREAKMIVDLGSDYGPQGCGFRRMNIASPKRYIAVCLDSLNQACQRRGIGR